MTPENCIRVQVIVSVWQGAHGVWFSSATIDTGMTEKDRLDTTARTEGTIIAQAIIECDIPRVQVCRGRVVEMKEAKDGE